MAVLEEQTMRQIDSDIEDLSKDEKKFALWLLLKDYDANNELPDYPNTLEEYREYFFRKDISVVVKHLIEVLGFELF